MEPAWTGKKTAKTSGILELTCRKIPCFFNRNSDTS